MIIMPDGMIYAMLGSFGKVNSFWTYHVQFIFGFKRFGNPLFVFSFALVLADCSSKTTVQTPIITNHFPIITTATH